jgi:hypothetical protein
MSLSIQSSRISDLGRAIRSSGHAAGMGCVMVKVRSAWHTYRLQSSKRVRCSPTGGPSSTRPFGRRVSNSLAWRLRDDRRLARQAGPQWPTPLPSEGVALYCGAVRAPKTVSSDFFGDGPEVPLSRFAELTDLPRGGWRWGRRNTASLAGLRLFCSLGSHKMRCNSLAAREYSPVILRRSDSACPVFSPSKATFSY